MTMSTDATRRAELQADPSLSKFITTRGKLTVYAFACGYVETKFDGNVRLYLDGTWHVRDRRQPQGSDANWQVFDTLNDARRAYNAITE